MIWINARACRLYRLARLTLAIIITALTLTPGALADNLQPIKEIRSACEIDYPPFCVVKDNGEVDGFSIEIFRAALEAMGAKVTFKAGPWAEVKALLETGAIDALPLVGRTPEREDIFDFSFPYLTLHGAIVVRKSATGISDISHLAGKKVAVMSGDNAEEFIKRSNIDVTLTNTPTFLDAFRLLSQGDCDAVIIQRLVALRIIAENKIANLRVINKPITDFKQDFCFAVKEGDKESLALLNEGLAIVMADGTYRRLHAKWFANLELPDNRKIIIGGDYTYPPFEFINDNGEPEGLSVDLTKAIARATGLDFEIRLMPWPEAMESLEKGTIDVIQGMLYSTERDAKFDFSPPHTINHCVGVRRKNTTYNPKTSDDLKKLKLAVQRGDIMHDYLLKHGIASNVLIVESPDEALRVVAEGKVDLSLLARLTALYYMNRNKINNIELLNNSFITPEYGYAVQNNQRALLAKLAEGMRMVEASGEYREIQKKWLGLAVDPKPSFNSVLRYLAIFVLPLILATCIFFLWSWSLRKKVAIKTEELRRSEKQFRSLIEGAPYGIFVQVDTRFVYANNAACQIFGADNPQQLYPKPVVDMFQERFRAKILERIHKLNIEKEQVPSAEVVCVRLDGKEIEVETSAVPVVYYGQNGAMVYMRDITERTRMASQLRQAQKMEAVGQLAGGVAHDFNNMLSVIMGYAEMTMERVKNDTKTLEFIEEIIRATRKSGDITGQLLAFARQQPISPQLLDLRESVDSALKMLRRLIGEDIELSFSPGNKNYRVKLDPTQLDQILANLCVNARDAIGGVGKITISLASSYLNNDALSAQEQLEPGNYVLLQFKDTGCGMSPETLDKIFEPFYSTKAVGKGTGLGLATVYGIVKQNRGLILVNSKIGDGTIFNIYLPEATGEIATSQNTAEVTTQGQGEIILIVEDDDAILQLAKKIVEMHGYKTIATASPDEALEIAQSTTLKIALLLTDVVMPGMNGKDLADRVKMFKPEIKCLFMSGYTADVIANRGVIDEGLNFISKPFSMRGLMEKISHILNELPITPGK